MCIAKRSKKGDDSEVGTGTKFVGCIEGEYLLTSSADWCMGLVNGENMKGQRNNFP